MLPWRALAKRLFKEVLRYRRQFPPTVRGYMYLFHNRDALREERDALLAERDALREELLALKSMKSPSSGV